jgi:hypothetical protein
MPSQEGPEQWRRLVGRAGLGRYRALGGRSWRAPGLAGDPVPWRLEVDVPLLKA